MSILQAILSTITAFLISILPIASYTEGLVGQPASFLPSQLVTQEDKTISRLLYRGLFNYDIYGTLVPDLADTWSISDDSLIYTIKLKDNQYWSNGRKITSDDLLYTAFKVSELTGVATDKVDDLTVRYILPNKYSPFLSLLTVGVMPVNAEEKTNPLNSITSGDFTVGKVEKNGSVVNKIILVSSFKNLGIKKIIFRYYTNEDELVTASKLGEIDGFISRDTYKLENFTNYRFPTQGIYYALFFNLRDEKLKNVALRQKLEKVLPADDMVVNRGIRAEGAISKSLFTNQKIVFNKFNKLFQEKQQNVALTITIPDTNEHYEFSKLVKAAWEDKLGIDVTIRKIPPEDMMEKVITPRNFEVLLYGQEVGRDPDRYVNWHSTQKDSPGLNLSGFDFVRADRALEAGRDEIDNATRVLHYNEFQKVVDEEMPAIFLYHPYVNFYVSKYIQGIGDKYTFTTYDRFLDFPNWKRVITN